MRGYDLVRSDPMGEGEQTSQAESAAFSGPATVCSVESALDPAPLKADVCHSFRPPKSQANAQLQIFGQRHKPGRAH